MVPYPRKTEQIAGDLARMMRSAQPKLITRAVIGSERSGREARQPRSCISPEAQLTQLAVVDDIDAEIDLLAHDLFDAALQTSSSAAVSYGSPANFFRYNSSRSGGRCNAPVWVVKIRDVLRSMIVRSCSQNSIYAGLFFCPALKMLRYLNPNDGTSLFIFSDSHLP